MFNSLYSFEFTRQSDYDDGFIHSGFILLCLSSGTRERLQMNQKVLKSLYSDVLNIDPIDYVLGFLYSHNTISNKRYHKILGHKTSEKRCMELWHKLINTKKEEALIDFRNATMREYPWIAEKITQEMNVKEFENQIEEMSDEDMRHLIALMADKLHCGKNVVAIKLLCYYYISIVLPRFRLCDFFML